MRTECINCRRLVPQTLAITAALTLGGCAATLAYTPVPESAVGRAQVAGYSNIRMWGDANAHKIDAVINLTDTEQAVLSRADGRKAGLPARSYLALSGGGGDGAYGAGVLVGWTASGDRPVFDVVTGVSTGALAAPFAFLGSAYDKELEEIYTQFKTEDLGNPQIFSAVFGGPSLVDASGLEELLAYYVNSELLAEVAREHVRGRRLLVATTNVEAERQVIWNLGAIAASKNADRLNLFRRILLASAAIPGVLPPVLIEVTVDGRAYQEMHADGGTVGQVFFIPPAKTAALEKDARAQAQLYVIRNGKIGPAWQSIEPTIFKIANRSLETLIKSQARGDVERLYAQAKSDGIAFHLAAVPASFGGESTEPFDKGYMRRLFDMGYAEARHGYTWARAPP
ncbi:MAG: patatin-like phospholipase family protein [Hyphomicrobium sp.]|uniref:patatin-like phospholipase family protein n=1 Tax=Hyphomicrobium sp. TaxID=82 RepID=UPI003D13774F